MDSKISDKILVVAIISQIIIFYFIERDGRIELIDSGISVPTDDTMILKITQFKKNGRIFYGGNSGHINELKYKD